MQINTDQMSVLAERAERDFKVRVAAFLRERHPSVGASLPAPVLDERVRISLARGREHGFTWQPSLVGFTVFIFELGPAFDQQPVFAQALAIRLPDQNARIKAVYADTSDEDWAVTRARADPDAWSRVTS